MTKPQNVTIGDLQSNPKGGKTAPILNDGKTIKLKITQDYQTTDLSKMNLADKKRYREVKAQIQTNSGKYSWNQKTIRNPNMSYHIRAEKV